MRNRLATTFFGALITASCGLGFAKLSPPSVTYVIQFRPPVGRHLHYGMQMDIAGAKPVKIGAGFSVAATKHAAGKYTMVTTIDSMTIAGMPADQVQKMISGTKVTQVVDESGRIVSTEAVGPMKAMMQGGSVGSAGAIFPKHPVHVGETWHGSAEAQGAKADVIVKLIGVKSVGGKQLAKLRLIPAAEAHSSKSGTITITIETATGILRTMEMSSDTGPAGPGSKMHLLVRLR